MGVDQEILSSLPSGTISWEAQGTLYSEAFDSSKPHLFTTTLVPWYLSHSERYFMSIKCPW